MHRALWLALGVALAMPASGQDARSWLQSQGLEAVDVKAVEDLEVVVARTTAADPKAAQERLLVLRKGKPLWQSNPKETEPGSHWTIHAAGRDLDGDGRPDLHATSFSGSAKQPCCTTHVVLRLKPQIRRLVAYSAGAIAGGEFVDVPGRKAPVMVSADDSSAHAFAPYATSYFPLVMLEVGPRGRLQLARDLMRSALPGQPPPVCSTQPIAANAWVRERCLEYSILRRKERLDQIKARLEGVKAARSDEKLDWEDYFRSGVLVALAAEVNRYTYTGHGQAGLAWLESAWPGNDPVKLKFVETLLQVQAKSPFARDLRALASGHR